MSSQPCLLDENVDDNIGFAINIASRRKMRHRINNNNRSVNRKLLAREIGVSEKNEILPTFRVFPFLTFHKCISSGMIIPAIAQSHMEDAKLINLSPPFIPVFQKIGKHQFQWFIHGHTFIKYISFQ